MSASLPTIETKPATLFTRKAILIGSLYGLVLVVPVVASMMLVTVLQFGVVTFLLPLATIAAVTFILPLGFGNPYLTRLVARLQGGSTTQCDTFVVQLTRYPRIRSGLGALLEDADDIGILSFTDSALVFHGDSVRLRIPYSALRDLELLNPGARALFVYGSHTSFSVAGAPEAGILKFAERSSYLLLTSRKTAKRMFRSLCSRVEAAGCSASTAM